MLIKLKSIMLRLSSKVIEPFDNTQDITIMFRNYSAK